VLQTPWSQRPTAASRRSYSQLKGAEPALERRPPDSPTRQGNLDRTAPVSDDVRRTGAILLTFVAACTSATAPPSVETTPVLSAQTSAGPTGADSSTCPVTKPVAAPASIGNALFGSAVAFGNDHLWVGGLGPNGVIEVDERFVSADGSIGWKFGWWRITSGDLKITGAASMLRRHR
jgi:hypothetical protein